MNYGLKSKKEPKDTYFWLITKLVAILIGVLIFFGIFYTIHAGERGIVLTFGAPSETVSSEGLHLKIPLIQKVIKMDVKTQKYEADASSASHDLQIVHTKVTVNYHLLESEVNKLYQTIGVDFENKIIQPAVQEVVKANTAKYTAEELITKRPLIKEDIERQLTERLGTRGIIVEAYGVSLTDFDFSPEFNKAIEAKQTAAQLALQAENDLRRIEVEAQQIEAQAEGAKQAKIKSAEGDAEAIKIVNEQLKVSPSYIEYFKLQKWDGVQPMYVGEATPMITIN